MKLIVGLGNIGKEYEHTRHNVGFDTIDILADGLGVYFKEEKKLKGMIATVNNMGHKAILLKPTTYMNLSGESVALTMKYYNISIDDIIVISDDLDMVPGKVRYREVGSAGGHNGLKNIITHCGTDQFKRIKIGIDRDKRIPVVDWVLTRPSKEDAKIMYQAYESVARCLADYIVTEDNKKLSTDIGLINHQS